MPDSPFEVIDHSLKETAPESNTESQYAAKLAPSLHVIGARALAPGLRCQGCHWPTLAPTWLRRAHAHGSWAPAPKGPQSVLSRR